MKAWLLVVGLFVSSLSWGQGLPEGEISFAYRQLSDGKLSKSVHQNWLECREGECSLTTLTLGQCILGAFVPKLERVTSSDGRLSVALVSPGVLLVKQELSGGGSASLTLRVTLAAPHSARMSGTPRTFSGAVVKQSDVLEKVIAWELAPIKILDPYVEFDCPMSLDGVRE